MDPEMYKQLGELQGRFNTFETNVTQQFNEVKQAIKEQSVVPYSVYEARTKATDLIHVSHEDRLVAAEDKIDHIQDAMDIREHTVTSKVAAFLDNAIVKIIGTGVITVVIFGVYLNYQKQIDSLQQKVDTVGSTQQVIKKEIINE